MNKFLLLNFQNFEFGAKIDAQVLSTNVRVEKMPKKVAEVASIFGCLCSCQYAEKSFALCNRFSKTYPFIESKSIIKLVPFLLWFRRHCSFRLVKNQLFTVLNALISNLMASSSANAQVNVDENVPLEIGTNGEEDDLEVIFVNSTPPLQGSPSSSLMDEVISGSGALNSSGKFSSCAASSSGTTTARISPMMCAFHVNNNRITPIIGGKTGVSVVSKCKVIFYNYFGYESIYSFFFQIKRKSDGEQTPSMGKKHCQSSCGTSGGG